MTISRGGRALGAAVMMVGVVIGASGVLNTAQRWSFISGRYRVATVLLAFGVLALLAGAVALLASANLARTALFTGAVGGVLIGTTVMWGVLSGVIPCSGPS